MGVADDVMGRLPEPVRSLVSGVRLGQFLSAGVVGLVVDNLVLVALVEVAGLAPVVAKAGSWEAAVVVIFLVNERWTFAEWGDAGPVPVLRRFGKSNLIRLGGFAVTVAVLYGLTEWAGVWYVAANVAGIGAGFALNYCFESLITWRVHRG